jgi:hypothetical protein
MCYAGSLGIILFMVGSCTSPPWLGLGLCLAGLSLLKL